MKRKKKIGRIVCSVMILLVFGILSCPMESRVFAGNQKSAMEAYQKILKKNEYHKCDYFYLTDINGDGVKEMYTESTSYVHGTIWQYKNHKAVEILSSQEISFAPNKHLMVTGYQLHGEVYSRYYIFKKNGTLKLAAEEYGNDTYNAITGKRKEENSKWFGEFEPYRYTVNDKRVTAKKYKQYVKNLEKGAKFVDWKEFHKNTAANRKIYLSGRTYYSVSQTGIGSYGEENAHYETDYEILSIHGDQVTYRQIYDYEAGSFSKKKTYKLAPKAKCYAIDASLFQKNADKNKNKAIYMYRITREKALSIAKVKYSMVWMRIKNGSITAMVVKVEDIW